MSESPDVAVQSTLSADDVLSMVLNSCMSTLTQVCDDPIENILSIEPQLCVAWSDTSLLDIGMYMSHFKLNISKTGTPGERPTGKDMRCRQYRTTMQQVTADIRGHAYA